MGRGLSGSEFYDLPQVEQDMYRARYYRQRDKHACGFDFETCGDPSHKFYVQRHVCQASMKQAAMEARYDEHYSELFHDGTFQRWSGKRTRDFPYGHRDGVTFYVTETDDASATWHLPPRRHGSVYLSPQVDEGGD